MIKLRVVRSAVSVSVVALTLFLVAGGGCADEPSSVGSGILPGSDFPVFFVDTLYPTSFASAYKRISTASTDLTVPTWVPTTLFIGRRQSLEAGTYIRFREFPDSLRGIVITSAEVVLYANSVYGDSLDIMTGQYTVYRGRGTWSGDSLTYDSLDASPGTYFDPVPRPVGPGTVRIDTGTVSLPIDTSMVREWFTVTIDTGSNNRGMFLTAQPANTIWGFWSFAQPSTQVYPILRVQYLRNGVPGSYSHRTGFARYLARMPENDLITDPSKMYVHTGLAYRTHLAFSFSSLPLPVTLNRARLQLTLDSASSDITTHSTDSLFAFAVRSDGSIEPATRDLSVPNSGSGQRIYEFSADRIVRYWQIASVQSSIVVAGFAENASLTRFVFHGPAAAVNLRPRLIVTYSRVLKTGDPGEQQ